MQQYVGYLQHPVTVEEPYGYNLGAVALPVDGLLHAVTIWVKPGVGVGSLGTVDGVVAIGNLVVAKTESIEFTEGMPEGWYTLPLTLTPDGSPRAEPFLRTNGEAGWVGAGTSGSVQLGRDVTTLGKRIDLPDEPISGGSNAARAAAFAPVSAAWVPPDVTDDELAEYGWPSAQAALTGAGLSKTARQVSLDWHHTNLDPRIGAYAIAREGGPLEDLVGQRLRLTRGGRSCNVYVTDLTDDLDADLTLPRRVFLHLGDLGAEQLTARMEVLRGAAG